MGQFVRNSTSDTIPIDVNRQFNVFNASVPCSGNDNAELSVDADVILQGGIDLGVIAQGTLIPPKFDKFGLFASVYIDDLAYNPSNPTSSRHVGGPCRQTEHCN